MPGYNANHFTGKSKSPYKGTFKRKAKKPKRIHKSKYEKR